MHFKFVEYGCGIPIAKGAVDTKFKFRVRSNRYKGRKAIMIGRLLWNLNEMRMPCKLKC